MSNKRVVITGIGPMASAGIGKDNFWEGILNKKTNVKLEKYALDGQPWDEFYLHKVDNFDLSKFGIDKDKLEDIKAWKEGDEVPDLNYLIAVIKLALDDSKLDYNKEDNEIGLVLAHENIGLMQFSSKISNFAYDYLIDKKRGDLTKQGFLNTFYAENVWLRENNIIGVCT